MRRSSDEKLARYIFIVVVCLLVWFTAIGIAWNSAQSAEKPEPVFPVVVYQKTCLLMPKRFVQTKGLGYQVLLGNMVHEIDRKVIHSSKNGNYYLCLENGNVVVFFEPGENGA
jgi:hypothetical protein